MGHNAFKGQNNNGEKEKVESLTSLPNMFHQIRGTEGQENGNTKYSRKQWVAKLVKIFLTLNKYISSYKVQIEEVHSHLSIS